MKPMLALASLCVFTGALPACATPLTYSAEAIDAKVIDADTKQPLEDVIVTANWELRGGGLALGGSSYAGELMVLEAVTDQDGRFRFPAWGPIRQFKGELHNHDPRLILFKSGYRYEILSNKIRLQAEVALEPVRRSDWNGKTIELKPFRGSGKEYESLFKSLNNEFERIAVDMPEECSWKKIPNTIRAMNRERGRLISEGANPNTLSSIDKRLLMNDEYFTKKGGCGSPKAFFEDLQK